MKLKISDLQEKFITDNQGDKKSVVLDIEKYQDLMEILKDLQHFVKVSILENRLQSAHNLQRFMDLNIKFQIPEFKVNFLNDDQGNKKSAIIDIEEYQDLIATIEDLYNIIKASISKDHTKDTYTLEELQKLLNNKINNKN
ncbi:hypothetical protein [Candidatus Babela massiliensis]|uniref:Uncharacterized protein n=1 Tax=Candidatus Babela massiliensis TaxID=673862 RepID=V6DIP6_9BACT|nr:hypothetical protein [Candidatus Babela massiliensis]CDK30803.1 hypothetical protein BABL1_gene_212 [Candidatus Babela massiliensis]